MVKTNKDYAFNADSPVSVAQALRHEHANEFMSSLDDEMERLLRMGSYDAFFGDINSIDRGKLLRSKCIFSIKYKPDGTFDKYKCRIVARGDMLKSSPESDLYAGTVRSDSMRLLYSIIASEDLDLMSIDVKTAFLYPPLPDSEMISCVVLKGLQMIRCQLSCVSENVYMDYLRLLVISMITFPPLYYQMDLND
jgi:hypothetical protein